MRPPASRWAGLALVAVLVVTGCQGTSREPGGPIQVVTSTTVFADMIANVGGDLGHVTSLVPRNGAVHPYAAKPSDVEAVADAQLLVMNGLGLDDWLTRTIANASAAGHRMAWRHRCARHRSWGRGSSRGPGRHPRSRSCRR